MPATRTKYYCRGCRYELTGLGYDDSGADPICPECGSAFRPGDPKSTTLSPHGPARRFINSRRGRVLILLLLLAAGVYFNVLPRPVVPANGTAVNWSHWEWLGADFGTQRLPGMFVSGSSFKWVNWEVSWWAGEPRGVRGVDPDTGRMLWQVKRLGGDRFRLDVENTAVEWSDLLTAFNAVRRPDEFFGISIAGATHTSGAGPFSVSGHKHEVLAELIRRYGMTITTMESPNNDGLVWVFDAGAGEMRLVSPGEAVELGYDPRPFDGSELPRPFGG